MVGEDRVTRIIRDADACSRSDEQRRWWRDPKPDISTVGEKGPFYLGWTS